MISLYESQLILFMPEAIKTPENICILYAFDEMMKDFLDISEQLKVWCDIDNMDIKKLDFFAAESRTLYYEKDLPEETKRNLLKNSLKMQYVLGTREAVDDMINTVFGDGKSVMWYEYSGCPYHFKIITKAALTPDMLQKFSNVINKAKNLRSLLDTIEVQRFGHKDIFYGIETVKTQHTTNY